MIAGLADPQFFRSPSFVRLQFWIICLYIFSASIYAYATGQYEVGARVGLLPARMQNVIYACIWLLCALSLALSVVAPRAALG